MGGKRPRQSHGVLVLPEDAGVASVAEKYTRETDVYASQRRTGSNLADLGRKRRAPLSLITEAGNSPECRRADGEAVVTRCGVVTAMSQGPSRMPPPPSDQQVNTGTVPGPPGHHAASVVARAGHTVGRSISGPR
jgi:hypothetical protein